MIQTLPLLRARCFLAVDGVTRDEPISFADELVLDDVFALIPPAKFDSMTLALGPKMRNLRIQPGSPLGTPGHAVHLDCCVTFMDHVGATHEALILVEVDEDNVIDIYLLPFTELEPETRYTLIGIDRHAATKRFSEIACVSIMRGTRITMADGMLKPVETLQQGDLILTRDSGAQALRWCGSSTTRAIGSFAPVRIRAGALSNMRDLCISPDTRLLIYQRKDMIEAGQPEVMVRAKKLINGKSVVQEKGRHVDYFQLLFDQHEIIFAEGQAVETLHLTRRTAEAVPEEISATMLSEQTAQPSKAPTKYEVSSRLLSQPEAIDLLKKSTLR